MSINYFYLIFLSLIFIGCTVTPTTKPSYHYKKLIFQGKNTFHSSPRKVIINDNKIYISFDNGDVGQWDTNTKQFIHLFQKETLATNRALLFKNFNLYIGSSDMNLYRINSITKKMIHKNYFKGSIFDLTAYNKYLFVAFGDASIGVIDSSNLELITSYRTHQYLVYSLFIDQKNKILYSGSDDNTIIKWKILEDSTLKKLKLINGFTSAIRNIVKLKNHFVVTTGDGHVYLYDETFTTLLDNKNQENNIVSALSDKDTLYTGNTKGEIYLYKIKSNSLHMIKKYVLHGVIRSIVKKDATNIFILSKSGEALLLKNNTSLK
jgi:hypothetical protein